LKKKINRFFVSKKEKVQKHKNFFKQKAQTD